MFWLQVFREREGLQSLSLTAFYVKSVQAMLSFNDSSLTPTKTKKKQNSKVEQTAAILIESSISTVTKL